MQSFFMPEGSAANAFIQDDSGIEVADTFNGIAQKNARMWQVIALVSLSSFFTALGIIIWAMNQPQTIPVVVTVNSEGEAAYVGKLDKSKLRNANIPEIAREYQIKRLIQKMHSWIIDREAQQNYIDETRSIVQAGAVSGLDKFYRTNNPFENIGEITRSVTLDPPLKQTDKTYIVYFNTVEKNRLGYETKNERWSALVNLDEYMPTETNPLGLYITNFDIKKVEDKKR